MRATGVTASRVRRSGRLTGHGAGAVGDHHQRPSAVLRRVPGVEQLLLVVALGLVEQAPADPRDEAARQQRPARSARPGQDRRLDRPHRPLAEMIERRAIGVADEEALVLPDLRPVERKRDLVAPASLGAGGRLRVVGRWLGWAGAAGGAGGAARGVTRSVPPTSITDQPARRHGRGQRLRLAAIGHQQDRPAADCGASRRHRVDPGDRANRAERRRQAGFVAGQ